MSTALAIFGCIGYLVSAGAVAAVIHRSDRDAEEMAVFGGIFWPLALCFMIPFRMTTNMLERRDERKRLPTAKVHNP